MRFDLTDLRLFTTVVRNGSITRGAEAMNLALAAASQRIAGMEATIGIPLLQRSQRGVQPTAAGDVLLRHAHEILFRAKAARRDAYPPRAPPRYPRYRRDDTGRHRQCHPTAKRRRRTRRS